MEKVANNADFSLPTPFLKIIKSHIIKGTYLIVFEGCVLLISSG
jgi:hypothetical protein